MPRSSYSEGEVRALIENYEVLRASADTSPRRLRFVFLLADLDAALARLTLKDWAVVLLHGIIGIPQDETARLLHVSQQAVSKRYRLAVEDVHYLINGGTD